MRTAMTSPGKASSPPVPGMPRGNAHTMREVNDLLVLNCLRQHQPIASIQIAEMLAMEPATVSKVLRRLSQAGFVRKGKLGAAGPHGGRRPRLLYLEERARLVIGVDVAWKTARGIVVDLVGNVLERSQVTSSSEDKAVLTVVGELVQRLPTRDRQRLAGIGVGVPAGAHETGVVYTDRGELPLADRVASAFGVEAFVDENSNAFAMAEKHFGFGRGVSSLLCMWYRHGVGHALMIDGRLYRGACNSFGETRHYLLPDRPDNRPDDPTHVVEVRPQAIAEIAARMGERCGPFLSAARNKETPEEVIAAVAEGIEAQDPATRRALDELAHAMSVSLSLLGDLFDPEVLVIGGPLTRWGAPMLDRLRRRVGDLADMTTTRQQPPRLEFTCLGDDVIALGGAALVMERVFERIGLTTVPG